MFQFFDGIRILLATTTNFCVIGEAINPLYPLRFIVFGLSCAVFGCIILSIDCLYFGIQQKSFFKLQYRDGNKLKLILVWAICAGGVGFLGTLLEVVQINIHATIAIAVSWTYILPRIILHSNEDEPTQQPIGDEI